jgi:hypothetical protein
MAMEVAVVVMAPMIQALPTPAVPSLDLTDETMAMAQWMRPMERN